jgi:hypothetical protein
MKGVLILVLVFATASQLCGLNKRRPHGVAVVLPCLSSQYAIDSAPCWKDPNITGVLLRVQWRDFEPTLGNYDWSYIDYGIQLCESTGKFAQLSINFGDAPSWIYGLGAEAWHPTGTNDNRVMPMPWDPIFQQRAVAVIQAFGARYDHIRVVEGVTMWVGGRNIEAFFAQSRRNDGQLDAAGGPQIWIAAAETLIDEYAAAFPHTRIFLATGVADHDENATTIVARHLLSNYPSRSGLQSNALSAHYPSYNNSKGGVMFPHTYIAIDSVPAIIYQMLAPIGSPRMQSATLAECLNNANNFNADCVQVYPRDPATDPEEASIQYFNASHNYR